MKLPKRAHSLSVRALLEGPEVFSPLEPRSGYRWNPAELAGLLTDLDALADEPADRGEAADRHYLGSLTFGCVRTGVRPIVDGLQRLCAIALILATIRDRLPGRGERAEINRLLNASRWGGPGRPRLQLEDEEGAWFSTHVIKPGATLKLPSEAPPDGRSRWLGSARFLARELDPQTTARLRGLIQAILDGTTVVVTRAVDAADQDRLSALRRKVASQADRELDPR